MSYPVFWVPASSEDFARGRNGKRVIAIVHHRMVGSLAGTDRTFQSSTNRPVSTHFGIGYNCEKAGHPTGIAGVHIHQYVDLADTAFGNGNYDATGRWDDWGYPISEINARTVSIEHHDNGGATLGSGKKGVVPEAVIAASIWLDRLLIHGTPAAIRAAGVRARDDVALHQINRIVPGPRTLIMHNDIAGRLKPYCWKPWADDPVGYPRARYVKEVSVVETAPPAEETVNGFDTPEVPMLATLREDPERPGNSVWIYTTSACTKDGKEVSLSPMRPLQFVGHLDATTSMVGYEPSAGDTVTTNRVMFVKRADIVSTAVAPNAEAAALRTKLAATEAKLAQATATIEKKKALGLQVEGLGAQIKT